jgi:hypothetical protein
MQSGRVLNVVLGLLIAVGFLRVREGIVNLIAPFCTENSTNRRTSGSGACSDSNPPGMRKASWRRMALSPRTSVLDATCYLLPCTAKQWPKDSRSAGRSRARRWPRKGRVEV